VNEQRPTFDDVRDILLTDVAIRIQLSPSLYRLAVERMDTLAEWLDREGSELAGCVTLLYPQGSMAVNATVAACRERDEFDIDLIAQLRLPPGTTPQAALDLLYRAIKGDKGSRYYSMTKRNTRCVTIQYAEMHLDVTPAELLPQRDPRTSYIFHHRPEEPHVPGKRVLANPFGFAEWFNAVTPRDLPFREFFEKRAREADPLLMKAADTEEVPAQIPAFLKPPAVIALQLMKRNRNIKYEKRSGRRPPSVMLAKIIAESGSASGRPFAELLYQGRHLLVLLEAHHQHGTYIHVVNPRCEEDVFTDRWPASLAEQEVFVNDMRSFVTELQRLEHTADLETIAEVFGQLFGEQPTQSVIREFADRAGESIAAGRFRSRRSSGQADLAGSSIIAAATGTAPAVSRSAPRHTFYGTDP
jgi:hypothetical protein